MHDVALRERVVVVARGGDGGEGQGGGGEGEKGGNGVMSAHSKYSDSGYEFSHTDGSASSEHEQIELISNHSAISAVKLFKLSLSIACFVIVAVIGIDHRLSDGTLHF